MFSTDVDVGEGGDCYAMESSTGRVYAVVFAIRGDTPVAGALRFTEKGLLVSGGNGHRREDVHVDFEDIGEVRIGRRRDERLADHPTLVVTRKRGRPLLVMPLGAGFLHEIADVLADLTTEKRADTQTLLVRVPLRAGAVERVRELLADGPPIDPASLHLTGHQVYLHDREALFVFTGSNVQATLRKAARSPALWRAGIAWRELIDGQPSIEDDKLAIPAHDAPAYHWPPPEA